jgi:4-methyl-5(b-hydroxyethyl)-thiazole monophosphate biosynthesis
LYRETDALEALANPKKNARERARRCAQLVHREWNVGVAHSCARGGRDASFQWSPAMAERKKRVLLLVADGFEEIEAVTLIDVLRRADLDVMVASPDGAAVNGAHAIRMATERRFADVKAADHDALVLPGGANNARTLATHAEAQRLIKEARALDLVVGAICAAPLALKAAGVIQGAQITSFPGMERDFAGEKYRQERVVKDGRLITSRGPGTALEFALALVAELCGAAKAAAVAGPMVVD